VAFTAGSALRPSEVGLLRGGRLQTLSDLNPFLRTRTLGAVQKLPVTASFDRRTLDAWITLPPTHSPGQRHPLILEIHGGPFASYGPHFSTDHQLYASAGYVVLSLNPRGSTSYGEGFANEINRNFPGHDYDDLMDGVNAAIAAGVADPDALFVTGGSAGGTMTAWIVGKTSRFRAAVAQKPIAEWAGFSLLSDEAEFYPKYWFGRYPWEAPQHYWDRSPLSLMGKVSTPTLVIVGTNDYRTTVAQAEILYGALQARRVPTGLVLVPGANHDGLTDRPSQSAARAAAIIAWFDRFGSSREAAAK
jgi:dipeptidyl aminopeptidase/acylaminoacyl peptidase